MTRSFLSANGSGQGKYLVDNRDYRYKSNQQTVERTLKHKITVTKYKFVCFESESPTLSGKTSILLVDSEDK